MTDGTPTPPPTVLVVEDDARIAAIFIKGLTASGFAVDWVTTGTEALTRLAADRIGVLVLDLGLPDIDGLDVLRDMIARDVAVPTVVVTARTDPRDRAAAMALGVKRYLTKPFAWAEVLAAVRGCSDRAG
ncbi:MAG: response regulator transcription factor [Acidimicrobiia bacterium]